MVRRLHRVACTESARRTRRHAAESRRQREQWLVEVGGAYRIESLERRTLLSATIIPTSSPLNVAADEINQIIKTASEVQKVRDQVDSIHDKLSSAVADLPLVGDALKGAIDTGADAFDDVAGAIKDGLDTLASIATVTGTEIQDAIFGALGPGGLDVLPAAIATAADVPIQLCDTDGNLANAEEVLLDLGVEGTLFSAGFGVDFDLGLDALGLSIDGDVQADVTFDINLKIGLNKTDTFFIDLSANHEASLGLSLTTPGLTAQGRLAFLQLDATDGTAEGNTGLTGTISADLSDGGDDKLLVSEIGSLLSNSTLSASAAADVHLHAVVSFGGSANFPSLQADFDLHWDIGNATIGADVNSATFGGTPDVAFNNIKLDLGTFFSNFVDPIIGTIQDILDPVQPVIDVLKTRMPVLSDIGLLSDKFDGIDPGTDVSLIETIAVLSPSPALKFIETVIAIYDFIDDVPTGVGSVAIDLGSFSLAGEDPRGLADLAGVDVDSLADLDIADIQAGLTAAGALIGGETGAKVAGFIGKTAETVFGGAGGLDGEGLKFPILEDPKSVFGLFLGKDVSLFTFDTPGLQADFHMDEFFPILGPLGVQLRGDFEVKGHFAFGYDTQGLVDFTEDLIADNTPNPELLFNGFFISDTDRADGTLGTDIPELSISASIEAFAALNVVVVSAGVGGGIAANVTVDLHDPDGEPVLEPEDDPSDVGKIRFDDIAKQFQKSPLCLFDVEGQMTAGLSAFVKVGVDIPFVGFVGWQDTFNIAQATLLDFSFGCKDPTQPDPVLATDVGGGVLRLNMGPFASARGAGLTVDDDEEFTVKPGANPNEVVVEAFGFSQTYGGITHIVGEGGLDDDLVIIEPAVTATAEIWGDFADPNLAGDFGDDELRIGAGTLHGNAGNDVLALSEAGTAFGDDGDDQIFGSAAGDALHGNAGNDQVDANGGDDEVTGGTGDDVLTGGDGDDTMDGGADNDQIEGGNDDDTITTGDGTNVAIGGDGDDDITGGSGFDLITGDDASVNVEALLAEGGGALNATGAIVFAGGSGADTIDAGGGNDATFGQAGDDDIDLGEGDDYAEGNDGADTITGDAGNDRLIGGSSSAAADGGDTITGDGGNDVIAGDNATVTTAGAVTLLGGGSGDDDLTGGEGDDLMFGGGGADKMVGDTHSATGIAGDDTMNGNDGDDTMLGDNGVINSVTLLGGDGDDVMNGGAGDDAMYGQGGDDTMNGDADDDYMEGNDGADLMNGGTGEDTMLGGNGTDTMNGGDDDDTMNGNDDADVMHGDAGHDTMNGNAGEDLMFGDAGNDTMFGNEDDDTMHGGTGDDYMEGNAGDDVMNGNEDEDTMFGNDGMDVMHGNEDDDTMAGNADDDEMHGDLGADTMDGGAGDDGMLGDTGTLVRFVETGAQQATLEANGHKVSVVVHQGGTRLWVTTLDPNNLDGNDVMTGGEGNDSMHAGGGNDTVRGDAANGTVGAFAPGGNDRIFGDGGNDDVNADGGADHVFGGGGDDLLDGGAQADIVYGGGGEDRLWADIQDDRLIDWFGNFNQFNVPGPGFGAQTIVRSPNPHMRQFLLDLGLADGSLDAEGELQVVVPPSPENSGPGAPKGTH